MLQICRGHLYSRQNDYSVKGLTCGEQYLESGKNSGLILIKTQSMHSLTVQIDESCTQQTPALDRTCQVMVHACEMQNVFL